MTIQLMHKLLMSADEVCNENNVEQDNTKNMKHLNYFLRNFLCSLKSRLTHTHVFVIVDDDCLSQ